MLKPNSFPEQITHFYYEIHETGNNIINHIDEKGHFPRIKLVGYKYIFWSMINYILTDFIVK